jgi:hypothetical protein
MNEHQKKLRVLGRSIYPNGQFLGSKNLRAIRSAVEDGHLKVVKTIPHASWWSGNFNDPKSTSTYEDCISVELTSDETIILLISDGENMHGQPIGDRVTFHLQGEWWRIYADQVDRAFNAMCMKLLEKQEEEARLTIARTIGTQLLKSFDSGVKNV